MEEVTSRLEHADHASAVPCSPISTISNQTSGLTQGHCPSWVWSLPVGRLLSGRDINRSPSTPWFVRPSCLAFISLTQPFGHPLFCFLSHLVSVMTLPNSGLSAVSIRGTNTPIWSSISWFLFFVPFFLSSDIRRKFYH